MPFEVDAPMVETSAPTQYPKPNWRGLAEVRECWLPDEKPVGWLIIQDNITLTWLSATGPERPAAYAVKELVQDTIQMCLREGLTCREAFNRTTAVALFRGSEDLSLAALAKRLQDEWS